MRKSPRTHLTYANVAATLALVFAMSGGALAAKHYLINSTKQISPSVLKKLKGKTGKTGKTGNAGATGLAGTPGTGGKEGKEGKEGKQGAEGAPGTARAYGAVSATGVLNAEHSKNIVKVDWDGGGIYCLKLP